MSYCRWSSMDWQCDLYVFDHVSGGTAVYVAGRRRKLTGTLPPPLPEKWWQRSDSGFLLWHEREQKVAAAYGALLDPNTSLWTGEQWETLPQPHAGQTYIVADHAAAIALIGELRKAGLQAPADLEQRLMETADDRD